MKQLNMKKINEIREYCVKKYKKANKINDECTVEFYYGCTQTIDKILRDCTIEVKKNVQ